MKYLGVITCMLLFLITGTSCKHEIPIVPGGTGNTSVCFSQDVLPVFQSNCSRSGCHNATTAADGYVLDSYANIIRRGIVPGDAGRSKIYEAITDNGPDRMPPAPLQFPECGAEKPDCTMDQRGCT